MTQKIALITGASRGFGAALAEELAALNWHVVAVARTTGALEELDDRIQAKGGSATLAPMDVTQADAMAALCQGVLDRWGGLHMWIHTAIHAAPLAILASKGCSDASVIFRRSNPQASLQSRIYIVISLHERRKAIVSGA